MRGGMCVRDEAVWCALVVCAGLRDGMMYKLSTCVNEFVLPADELSQKLETCVVSNRVLSTCRPQLENIANFQLVSKQ